jgi:hypothetical protein
MELAPRSEFVGGTDRRCPWSADGHDAGADRDEGNDRDGTTHPVLHRARS